MKIRCILEEDKPAEEIMPWSEVFANSTLSYDAVFLMCNADREWLNLGSQANPDMYDFDKLQRENVFVGKRSFTGTANLFGTKDINYYLHINKMSFINECEVTDAFAYRWMQRLVLDVFKSLNIPAELSNTNNQSKTAVCMTNDAFQELLNEDGEKIHVSAKNSSLIRWSYAGNIFQDNAWEKIYDYIKMPVPMANGAKKYNYDHINTIDFFNAFVNRFSKHFEIEINSTTDREKYIQRSLVSGMTHG